MRYSYPHNGQTPNGVRQPHCVHLTGLGTLAAEHFWATLLTASVLPESARGAAASRSGLVQQAAHRP